MVWPPNIPMYFLFEFDILCHTYGCAYDARKVRFLYTTLKNTSLKWFMRLGENTIEHWDTMRKLFLKKHQVYCRPRYFKEDIYMMD
jgi:hypothetical protein